MKGTWQVDEITTLTPEGVNTDVAIMVLMPDDEFARYVVPPGSARNLAAHLDATVDRIEGKRRIKEWSWPAAWAGYSVAWAVDGMIEGHYAMVAIHAGLVGMWVWLWKKHQ